MGYFVRINLQIVNLLRRHFQKEEASSRQKAKHYTSLMIKFHLHPNEMVQAPVLVNMFTELIDKVKSLTDWLQTEDEWVCCRWHRGQLGYSYARVCRSAGCVRQVTELPPSKSDEWESYEEPEVSEEYAPKL